jgi:ribosomal protein S18 acetylase RimI-like enzyme
MREDSMTAAAMAKGASRSEEQAIAVLTRAFAADPAARWAYPDPRQYNTHFPTFVRVFAGKAFDHGTDHGIDGLAAALWLPPEVHPDEDAIASVVQASVAEPQQEAMFAFMEEMGRYHPSEPHWYLPLIGVDPAHQGRGLGSILLRHALRVCDRGERKSAYLEATSDASRRLYEREGFAAIGTIQIGSSPPVYPMVREARTAALWFVPGTMERDRQKRW